MKNLGRPAGSGCSSGASCSFARPSVPPVFLLAILFLFPGSTEAQSNASSEIESSLVPWIGAWTIVDQEADRVKSSDANAIVEIRSTDDGKGLEITRKDPRQPDVKEVVIPDGIKRPVEAQNCTGWQAARWDPESGLLISSSETNCKDSGIFSTTSLRMILSTDQMVDILAVKAAGQTRIAVRHLAFKQDLALPSGLETRLAGAAARSALSAPWDLDRVIRLSKVIDTPILEAALLEKEVQLKMTAGALKQMRAAKIPTQIIDLLVALASPDKFEISRNGQVVLRQFPSPPPRSSTAVLYSPGPTYLHPGLFYNCYDPYGLFWGYPYSSWLSRGGCYSYYSPFWWDYPIFVPYGGASGGPSITERAGRVTAGGGYTQIESRDTGRHAVPRQGYYSTTGYSGGSSQTYSPGYSSGASSSGSYSSDGGSSGGGSSGGSSSAPSASPGGYSSGSSGGGQAVPR